MKRYNGNSEMAMRLYAWNLELSAAMWGPMSVLEIALRNSIHDALRAGRVDDDWWNLASIKLESREDKRIESALDKLAFANNYSPTADDVVGATSMGLWVGLLNVGVSRHPVYDYETKLWPKIQSAFPNRGNLGRRQLHAKFNRLRVLRNRIAHHEPIFMEAVPHRDLMIECIGYIDKDVANYVANSHRIDSVIAGKELAIKDGICSF